MDKTIYKFRKEFFQLFLVSTGAIVGSLIRWKLDNDLLSNLLGSFILAIFIGLQLRSNWQLLISIGFCASLTTFSGWLIDCFLFVHSGQILQALGLIFYPVALALGLAFTGLFIGGKIKSFYLDGSNS